MSSERIEAAYPLTPMQQGMLFHYLEDPASVTYCVQICHRIHGRLDASALRRAWEHLVDRHPALRTAFVWQQVNQPVQVVLKKATLPWQEHDWSSLAADERLRRLDEYVQSDRMRAFDLSSAPVMRMCLIRLGDAEHQFVWTFHHLLLDGWSHALLQQELAHAYAAFCRGDAPRLDPPRAHPEYMSWLQRQDTGRAEGFWRSLLKGFSTPASLDLAAPGAAPPPGNRHGRITVSIPPSTAAEVERFARGRDLTANTVVMGAWALTLGAYSGSSDVVFGSIVSGRPVEVEGVEDMVGMFSNTVPVRARTDSSARVLDWLRELQVQHLSAQQFACCAVADIQRWSELEPGSRLFDTVLSFENFRAKDAAAAAGDRGRAGLLDVRGEPVWEAPHHAIVLSVQLADGEVTAYYDRARVPDAFMRDVLDRLNRTLDAIVTQPSVRLASLPIDEAADARVQGAPERDCETQPSTFVCAHELIAERARRQPDSIALLQDGVHDSGHNGAQVTYRELDASASRLAERLRRCGVGRETIVGLCAARSVQMTVGVLGVLKAGAALLPIDPDYPDARIEYMLQDARPRLVLTTADLSARLSGHGASCLCLDAESTAAGGVELANRAVPASAPDSAAYIIYTSGSTGTPKGVIGLHAGLANRLLWIGHEYPFTPGERVLAKSSLSFIDGITELLAPLVHGAVVVLAGRQAARTPADLAALIARHRVSRITVVPTLLRMFLDGEPMELDACRIWVTSGEALSASTLARFGQALPRATLLNLYGASEASGDSLFADCSASKEVTIGRPIWNTSVHVLDRRLHRAPAGVPGELFVGGVGLARGYLDRPDLTAQAFIPDPFSAVPGARMYRTGDLVRRRADGLLEYVGRADRQVKIRGNRVELGELEAILGELPDVRQAAAVMTRGPEPRLAVYLAGRPAGDSTEHVRAHLEKRVPEFMLPASIEWLDTMPLTRSGKIDRAQLATRDAAIAGGAYEPPGNETERRLAQVFADVLKVKRVSVTASFLQLGGDSLQAVRVTAKARQAGVAVTPRQILELRTVRALAAAVAPKEDAAPAQPARNPRRFDLVSIDEATLARITAAHPDVEALYPLTSAQQEMLMHALAFPQSDLGVLQFCIPLTAPIQPALLKQAWQRLLDRHESLRTSISLHHPAQPLQVVHERAAVPWREHDWRMRSRGSSDRELHAFLAAERQARFEFDRAPLLRLALIAWKDGEYSFVLTAHHLIIDGWSFVVVFRELQVLYEALAKGTDPGLPAAPTLREYVRWLNARDLAESTRFWRTQLNGFSSPLLLSSSPPATEAEDAVGEEVLALSPQLTDAVTALARDADVTLNTAIEAAWALVLARCGGVDDVVFGVTVAGRPSEVEGIDRLVGMFINVLPLRLSVDREAMLRGWLADVQRRQLDIRPHEHTPRAVVHGCSDVPLTVPLFETVLVFQEHQSGSAGTAPAPDERQSDSFGIRTGAPVTLVVNPGPRLTLRVVFDARRIERARAGWLLQQAEAALAAMAGRLDSAVGAIDAHVHGAASGASFGPRPLAAAPAPDARQLERALLGHEAIADAAVIVQRQPGTTPRILAYVVGKPGAMLTVQSVVRFARRHLPAAVVPTDYLVLASLPRTAGGQVDRDALPAPASEHSTSRVLLMGGPSHDILEFQLARIWEDVLNVRPVMPDDNFFALGGTSLIGMALVARIKADLSYDVPLSALFSGATIRELAALLRTQTGSTAWASLVPIRAGGTRPPFFCVHPIGGNVLAFVDLVRHVDEQYPFYALQSIGLDGLVEPYSTVEEMAAHYLREIRAVQPEGPYALGGFSFGGLVAFELARRLEEEGAAVGLVALLDMECPLLDGRLIFGESMARDDSTLLRESSLTLRKLYAEHPEKRAEIDGLASQELIARVLEHLQVRDVWRENARRVFTILLHSSRALRDYVPRPYNGRLTVFRSTDSPGAAEYAQLLQPEHNTPEAMLAWRAFAAGGVELIEVPGDHITMLAEPHVRVLGEKLTACLDAVRRLRPAAAMTVAS